MEPNIQSDITDKLTKVCLCKAISRASVKKAILNGADTVEKVQKATGSGTGSCHGRRCTAKIEELLKQHEAGQY